MAFTYTKPDHSDRDLLRFVVGDHREARYLLEDAEHDYLLTTYGTVRAAAIPALDAMIAEATQRVNYSSGQERVDAGARVAALRSLRSDLVGKGYPDSTAVDQSAPSPVGTMRRIGRVPLSSIAGSSEWGQ